MLANFSQSPQWGNLIGILCLISPDEDRITMPSLSDTKGERMWVIFSWLPDPSLWWVSTSSLPFCLWFYEEENQVTPAGVTVSSDYASSCWFLGFLLGWFLPAFLPLLPCWVSLKKFLWLHVNLLNSLCLYFLVFHFSFIIEWSLLEWGLEDPCKISLPGLPSRLFNTVGEPCICIIF